MSSNAVVRSHAEDNQKLTDAFMRYLVASGLSSNTLRNYSETLLRFLEFLGSRSLLDADRVAIREFLGCFVSRGLSPHTIRRHTQALRAFYKSARLAGVSDYDPTFLLAHRKLPHRLPRVLSPDEVERLIGAAQTPLERAVVEVLYATGVRVSELVNFRLDDIRCAPDESQPNSIRLHNGKGGKDRIALFGSKAADAIRAYQEFRPSKAGFLFEAPARNGSVRRQNGSWYGACYVAGVQRAARILPGNATPDQARREFDRLVSKIPGFVPVPQRPYHVRAIRLILKTLAARAGLGRVHPHMLRHACASHMLQDGADLRVVQELLGHSDIKATAIYTHLSARDLAAVHRRAHPHG